MNFPSDLCSKIVFGLFFSAMVSNHAFAQLTLNSTDDEIISLTFNNKIDNAIELCKKQSELNPNTLKYKFLCTNAKTLDIGNKIREQRGMNRDSLRNLYFGELVEFCETSIDGVEEENLSLDERFFYAGILGYKARAYGSQGSWWSAFSTGLSARSRMEDIIEQNPNFYDAYLLLGMMDYYSDRMSGVMGFIAGMLGLSGDRDKGIEYMNLAFEKGTIVKSQALILMIELYGMLEGNEEESLKFVEIYTNKYPEHERYQNWKFQLYLRRFMMSKADEMKSLLKDDFFDEYALANYYFHKGDLGKSREYFVLMIQNKEAYWSGAIENANYNLALSYFLEGNLKKYKEYLPKLDENNRERIEIETSTEASAKDLFETMVLIGKTDNFSDEVIRTINQKIEKAKGNEAVEKLLLYKASYLYKTAKYNEALVEFSRLRDSEIESIKSETYHYLIDIYLKMEQKKQQVEALVEEIDDFDNDRLVFRSMDLEKKYGI
ncbi:MAG: hypothetical protein K9G44_07735 [Melioribacteraceae bacterium]|nr:hypothetical protein [Melioribacteraceae bacterium]